MRHKHASKTDMEEKKLLNKQIFAHKNILVAS